MDFAQSSMGGRGARVPRLCPRSTRNRKDLSDWYTASRLKGRDAYSVVEAVDFWLIAAWVSGRYTHPPTSIQTRRKRRVL